MARFPLLSTLLLLLFGLSVSARYVERDASDHHATSYGASLSAWDFGSCPSINNTQYETPRGRFLIECGRRYYGHDTAGRNGFKSTYQACIDACAANSECQNIAYRWKTQLCWMHYAYTDPIIDSTGHAARLLGAGYVSTCRTTITATTCAASTATIAPVTVTSTSTVVSAVSYTESASTVTSVSTVVSSASCANTAGPVASPTTSDPVPATTLPPQTKISCPRHHGAIYADQKGYFYKIHCDTSFDCRLPDSPCFEAGPSSLDFGRCIDECQRVGPTQCIAAAWHLDSESTCTFVVDTGGPYDLKPQTSRYAATLVSAPPCSSIGCPNSNLRYCSANGRLFLNSCFRGLPGDPIAGYNLETLGVCADSCAFWEGAGRCNAVVFLEGQYRDPAPSSPAYPSTNCFLLASTQGTQMVASYPMVVDDSAAAHLLSMEERLKYAGYEPESG